MLKRERQALILREVNIHNKVLLTDLSEKFNVSEDTVRRDLHELAEMDKIIKVRGGALSKSYQLNTFRENDIYAYQEKTVIANKVINLLQDGMLVLISGGTTNLEIARILPPDLKCTFLTPSLSTAIQLLEHQRCDTIFLGGQLSRSAKIAIGGEVVQTLNNFHPDICLLGTNGIDPSEGITDSDWAVVTVKRAMIQASSKVAILTIAEKLNSVLKIKVCGLNEIDFLITELDPGDDALRPYRNAGLKVL
jgi:DeoR/GlpR family transcriptional regulator of sugar metabolism